MRIYLGFMGVGLFFLIGVCAIMGWRHYVGPLPRAAGVVLAIFGFLMGTALLLTAFVIAATSRWRWPG